MSDQPEPIPEVGQAEEVVNDPVVENESPVNDENEEEKDQEGQIVLEEIVEEKDDNLEVVSKDYSKDQCIIEALQYIVDSSDFFNQERDWKQEHYIWLHDFLNDPEISVIFFWNDPNEGHFKVSNVTPPQFYNSGIQVPSDYQFVYFIKRENDGMPINTLERFKKYIHCQWIANDPLDDLLAKMNNEYLKKLLNENDWPEGVKLEFFANLHRFMAFLNETTYLNKGQTYLYIPDEDLSVIDAVVKDKDKIQRLETTVIQWTRQIKELVSNQDSPSSNSIESPLDEILFWEKRNENLNVLTQRLQHKDLKKIIKVLEQASSSYLPGFQELERKIILGQEEAKDNMTFLQTLYEPCKKIQSSRPSDIPKILPDVLSSVRIIWELSKHYSTIDRMKSLLTKISNQIIRRCRAKINKEDMLDGDVDQCMADLQESIECCKEWRRICQNSQKMIMNYSSKRSEWTLDTDETIFAENDAFIQRCRDLIDICEGQLQFARKGANQVMPIFGGVKGNEYKNSIIQLEDKFLGYLQKIRDLKYDILDVKITRWHDDYGQYFKEQVKSLEIMWHHIIALAFKNVATIQDAVEMLENFESLAKRPLIKDYVHKKAAEMVYKMFKDELKEVEETYESNLKRSPPMPFSHPKYGGLAIWAQSLISRIDKVKKCIENLYFIPESPISKETIEKYDKLRGQLDGYIAQSLYANWSADFEKYADQSVDQKLESAILVQTNNDTQLPPSLNGNPLFAKRKSGLLESNFDSDIHRLLIEVFYWNKIQALGYITIPHYISRLLIKKEQLRILRENVMLIVRDYNNIQHTIQDNEKGLFQDHLQTLDNIIRPGIVRLNWNSNADSFVFTCRQECQFVYIQVKTFQNSVQDITNELNKISSSTLTNTQKKLYLLSDFIRSQEETLKIRENDFVTSFNFIMKKTMEIYEIFQTKGQKIQLDWLRFISKQDEALEKSLKQTVKNTLLDLSKHIIGDKLRQDLVPIFRVYSQVDTSVSGWSIYTEPTHEELKINIQTFMKKIVTTTRVIPRIEKVFREKRTNKINELKKSIDELEKAGQNTTMAFAKAGMRSDLNYQNMAIEEKESLWKAHWELPRALEEKHEYEERIVRNKKINVKIIEIIQGIEAIQLAMNNDCQFWMGNEMLSNLRIMNTQKGKARILKGRAGDSDQDPIIRYTKANDDLYEHMNQISNHPAQKQEHFIMLDCSKLKQKLQEIGMDFQNSMYEYLLKESKDELYTLISEFKTIVRELQQAPEDYHKLKQNKELYTEVTYKLQEYENRREPIKRKFKFIKESENDAVMADFTPEDQNALDSLDDEWKKFQDGLEVAQGILTKATNTLRQSVETNLDEFKRECDENKKNFIAQAPINVDKNTNTQRAFEKLAEFKGICIDLRIQEEANQFGIDLFAFEAVNYTQLTFVETQISQLQQIWELKNEWDKQWMNWKDILFYDLDLNDMDFTALNFEDNVKNFGKDVKDWGVYNHIRSEVQKFRVTIPLLQDLRHPSMRERHWRELRLKVTNAGKEDFDETNDDFNMDLIFRLNLLDHQDTIIDIADRAQRQLKIEEGLKIIKFTWEESPKTNLEMEKIRSKAGADDEFYTIKSIENIMELIEEHGLLLGTMKSSPFYKEFDVDIDKWENSISQITETLEMLMAVQQKWKYLESIFLGQPELQKQLVNENSVFNTNHIALKAEMERINKDRNALRALAVKGFLQNLTILNQKFEGIQKQLSQFLKTKRGQFPRFFFLSNEDLLEIIGQAKDPKAIQHHISKMFEGIAHLDIGESTQGRGSKSYEIIGICSMPLEKIEFATPIVVDSQVESWLEKLVDRMKLELRKVFGKYYMEYIDKQKKLQENERLLNIIKKTQGQVLITCAQIQWTKEVGDSLKALETGSNPQAMKKQKQNYRKKVDNYIQLVEKSQSMQKVDRLRIVSLIIIDEHNREIIERLYQLKITSVKHFEWLQQLRFRRNIDMGADEDMHIQVDQTNCTFNYGYEYQGNNGRLVVTPLTDRAYMTLTNALNMYRGGAPQGPAGTGKTETVKDLGKNLALFVVIQNCSDQMDVNSLSKIFEGLARSGAWGCFDEFNRIQVEVLSVVAQKVQILLDAVRKKEKDTSIGGETFKVQEETGLFITMNPGYAGRSELPDNLACLFRPVAMMAPDLYAIAKITLMSEGFKQNEILAKKVVTIFDLMKKQLSKQDHYDFSMRAVKSVLSASGRIKREIKDLDETLVLIKAIRDMNLPKFIAEDVILFDAMFRDLFPDVDEAQNNTEELQIAIEECLIKKKLQLNENLVVKIMQLYESKVTRHGNMLVGQTMSGKTKCWEILVDALNQLNAEKKEENKNGKGEITYQAVKYEIINPKAVSIDELFGYMDETGTQWVDGVLSTVLKRQCQEKVDQRWIILDGPVDTLWIETLNSVLDDSKLLTLNNGDRIALTSNIRILFEVQDLAVASPATVSRAGMVYLDIEELGWQPHVTMWIQGKREKAEYLADILKELVEKYMSKVLKVKKLYCTELAKTSETACVINMCKLFDALCSNIKKDADEEMEAFKQQAEKWFVFCLIWSVAATVEEQSRREIDLILRDIDTLFPHANTVYEYYFNNEKKDFAPWDEKLQANWRPLPNTEFHKINVPTVDTVRNRFIVSALLDHGSQILLVGHSGVGKTVLIESILRTQQEHTLDFTINFSAGTSSVTTQTIIESYFERRAKNKYRPKQAKQKAICFIDDLNMPRKDTFGSQPPLELIRQWIDYEFWYDRQKIMPNNISGLQVLSAMGKPGGGRAEISPRILSKFHLINYTIPTETNMKRIFETLGIYKFHAFEDEIKSLTADLAQSTIYIFNKIQQDFLPTPAKSHYVFNMRDVSKVYQGLDQAEKNYVEGREYIIKLWAHETMRVFGDRLNSIEDQIKFKNVLNDQITNSFALNYVEHCTTQGQDPIFVNFMNDNAAYDEVREFDRLRELLNDKLQQHNNTPRLLAMNLVLFKDAITHVCRIYRILTIKRGHAFLVGVGGSGRHSLTRLASFIGGMNVFQVEVSRGFGLKHFREFLKEMYQIAAYRGKGGKDKLKSVFIFSDNDVVLESFLEDIQNMLNSGVVPGIFTADELTKIRDESRRQYLKAAVGPESPDLMNEWFFDQVRNNLHLCICMSPIGQAFRDYCRMYPALINNTTIDWFMGWPEDALYEVAQNFIKKMELGVKYDNPLSELAALAHGSTQDQSEEMKTYLKRIFYVTPTNYIELLKGYQSIISEKRDEVNKQATKLRNGLSKLDDARKQVETMSAASEIKRAEVSIKNKSTEETMLIAAKKRKFADEKAINIQAESIKVDKEKEETLALAAEAEAELKKAEPALLMAEQAISMLDKQYIAEVKSFTSPPPAVGLVMSAVMIVFQKDPSWQTAKKELADSSFIKKVTEFDKESISAATLKKIENYTKRDDFNVELIQGISKAAGALCLWVRSLEDFSKALKIVAPKRTRKAYAEEQLRIKLLKLEALNAEFAEIQEEVINIEEQLRVMQKELAIYQAELDDLKVKMERGDKLITGLQGEKSRWETTLVELDQEFQNLIGDSFLASAFMSYCGPFPSEYRESLMSIWMLKIEACEIPHNPKFDFSNFMSSPAKQRVWQEQGLATDKFSTENGVFVSQGLRWALNIDPQSQAMNWIKKMEGPSLIIADVKNEKYLKEIEKSITLGQRVLMIDVGENLDPVLDNVLNKAITQNGRSFSIKFGDNEIEYNKNFKLYITTRMSNPHYTPEVSCKVTCVNFSVKESGLEEQCLNLVIKSEAPQLEITKNDIITRISKDKSTITELENEILRELSEAKGNLLDNVSLIDTLNSSKIKSDSVKQALEQSEITMKRINDTCNQYRQCGTIASILFFVLNDMNKIDPMYQFSLEWYKNLFIKSIEESKTELSQNRQETINKYHQKQVYKHACRSLFERHKLLLSMQICIKLQMKQGEIDPDEWNFFLKGGQILERQGMPEKPKQDWITQQTWDNLWDLEKKLPNTFVGITNAVALNHKEWQRWYLSVKPHPPESAQFPGEWETKCEDKLKKMIVLRCFRVDRVNFAIRNYVEHFLKKDFVENKPTIISSIFEEIKSPKEPIIFVLSPGVDPTDALSKLALEKGITFSPISMGKGQEKQAQTILEEASANGNWVFLANCHLSISLLSEIETKIDTIFRFEVAENFRVILSANPHPDFSISLLQRSIKITMEPPRGIKSNMLRLYGAKSSFTNVEADRTFRKAIFGLCWFHTILIERKKFKSLGWNVTYSFNDSDYQVCEDLIANYTGRRLEDGKPIPGYDKKEKIPWTAICYMFADANYGGRITDDRDRRLIKVYAQEIFNDVLIAPERWRPQGVEEMNYYYPIDESNIKTAGLPSETFIPQYFFEQIASQMEELDLPAAYGQHINAEITSQILDASDLLNSILTLTPQTEIKSSKSEGGSSSTTKLILDLKEKVPELINYFNVKKKLDVEHNPLHVVLLQEIQRYAILMKTLSKDLDSLEKGIAGLQVISPEGEQILYSILQNQIPKAWSFAYFSNKPLANWFTDLNARYEFFRIWGLKGDPLTFWIGAFTYPTGFTTSLLQKYGRRNGYPIDRLEFDFVPVQKDINEISEQPKEGAYIQKLYLEGASWNMEKMVLDEPEVMELTCAMPLLLFKPIQKRTKAVPNMYTCPCYYYPIRQGTVDKDSFMFNIDIKSGDFSQEFWVKRGTAILMSLSS